MLPDALSIVDLVLLTAASFAGSLMSAALGVGGGSFLIIVMTAFLPPLALIPIHGLVQMGSNASRAAMTRQHIDRRLLLFFSIGVVLASAVSIVVLVKIDHRLIPVVIAVFILYLCWGKVPQLGLRSPPGMIAGGLLTSLATMLVGATGPLVSAWIGRSGLDKWRYTALFSSCMTVQHCLKILVFGLAGFSYVPWLGVLACMLIAAWAGTHFGLGALARTSEERFRFWFKWLLTLLAVRTLIVTLHPLVVS